MKYRALSNFNDYVDFEVEKVDDIRDWAINFLDLSKSWSIYKLLTYDEAVSEYSITEPYIYEMYDDGTKELWDTHCDTECGVFGVEVEVLKAADMKPSKYLYGKMYGKDLMTRDIRRVDDCLKAVKWYEDKLKEIMQ